jgi:glucan-binding YG repeat protein
MDRASKDKATKQMQTQLQLRAKRMQHEEPQLRDRRMQLEEEEMQLRDERMRKQLQLRDKRQQLEKMQTQLQLEELQLEEWQLRADENEALVEMQLRDERMQLEEMQLRDERMQLEIMQLRDEKLQLKMENDILLKKLSQCDNLMRSLEFKNVRMEAAIAYYDAKALSHKDDVVTSCFTATTWTCEMCTLINPHTSRSCQMCSNEKSLVSFLPVSRDDDCKYDK